MAEHNWLPPQGLTRVAWTRVVVGLNHELMDVCRQILAAERAGAATGLLERREAVIVDRLRQMWSSREDAP